MAARALHWHRRGLIQRSRACWQQSRWSSKGKAREADALKPEKQEQSFRGRYCVEGALLPNADLEVPTDSASQSIDDRLSNRTETKMSSQRLQQEASVGPGMYAETPKDRTAGVAKTYQVCKSQDHLDAFQSVYRRLRRTGRDAEDKDVSDSMLKAMEYVKQSKGAK
ncbi:unnamed protein product [Cladocopium goreaui]|uniref:Uncharacterized protein n=1 Tax=Cladocopium goreaui TaxID=2562237 RepID=A0A9P1FVL0_9DINO|nr:unnamed protein product [Cladocopium goreaui]